MIIENPIIVIPEQEGVDSTLQIIVKPNSDTVTVMELYRHWDGDTDDRLPTHLVNALFEAPSNILDLAKTLERTELLTGGKAHKKCKCIVHLYHLLDDQPIVCPYLDTALRVAKTIANHP